MCEQVDWLEYVELDGDGISGSLEMPVYEGPVGIAWTKIVPGVYYGRCYGWTLEGEDECRRIRVVVGDDKIISAVYA